MVLIEETAKQDFVFIFVCSDMTEPLAIQTTYLSLNKISNFFLTKAIELLQKPKTCVSW